MIDNMKLEQLTILIGENGSAKTAVLEAINYCLSPSFLSGRMKHTDFYQGTDEPIEVTIYFEEEFEALLPDGYTKQSVPCNGIHLTAKKRDKAKAGKIFTELIVTNHFVIPNRPKDSEAGWVQKRKNESEFKFDERLLSFPVETSELVRSFYFPKSREKQIKKGFNTSMSSVIDDFNWRYQRAIRNADPPSTLPDEKIKLEEAIVGTIDPKLLGKTFKVVNEKLAGFGLPDVELKILDTYSPFDNIFLSQVLESIELQTSNIGSGVEMLVALVFLETLATLSKEKIIILIDEPELHLHPKLQRNVISYFDKILEENQIICSTHSPYLYKDCVGRGSTELIVCKKTEQHNITINSASASTLFPWSPSWGEINYLAFDLPTVEFHNELYGYIQESNSAYTTLQIEAVFMGAGLPQSKQ